MANQTGRPIAPARKLVAAVLGTIAIFVMVFGLGLSSWAIVALGAALVALAVALGMVNVVRRGARAWVSGYAQVKAISPPPLTSTYGRAELQLTVVAPGLPTTEVLVRESRVPVAKWPRIGDSLPVTVDVDDMRRVRIDWTQADDRSDLGDSPPPPSYDPIDDYQDDDLLGDVEPPPWTNRDREWGRGPDEPPPYPGEGSDDTRVVVRDTPSGPVLEGQFVDHDRTASTLPRRPGTRPSPRPRTPSAAMATADPETDERTATASTEAAADDAPTTTSGAEATGEHPATGPWAAPPAQDPSVDPQIDLPLDGDPEAAPESSSAAARQAVDEGIIAPPAVDRHPDDPPTVITGADAPPDDSEGGRTDAEPSSAAATRGETEGRTAQDGTWHPGESGSAAHSADPAERRTSGSSSPGSAEAGSASSSGPITAGARRVTPQGDEDGRGIFGKMASAGGAAVAAAAGAAAAGVAAMRGRSRDESSRGRSDRGTTDTEPRAGTPASTAAGSAPSSGEAPDDDADATTRRAGAQDQPPSGQQRTADASGAPAASPAPADGRTGTSAAVPPAQAQPGAGAHAAAPPTDTDREADAPAAGQPSVLLGGDGVRRTGQPFRADDPGDSEAAQPAGTNQAGARAATTSAESDAAPAQHGPWSDLEGGYEPDDRADDLITSYPSARPGPAGAIHGVGITVPVTNLERSAAFYRDTLGFFQIDSGPSSAVLASGDTRLVLRAVDGLGTGAGRQMSVNLEVGDVEAVYEELTTKGVRFEQGPHPESRGGKLELWAATFSDPDGHTVAITQWRAIR